MSRHAKQYCKVCDAEIVFATRRYQVVGMRMDTDGIPISEYACKGCVGMLPELEEWGRRR